MFRVALGWQPQAASLTNTRFLNTQVPFRVTWHNLRPDPEAGQRQGPPPGPSRPHEAPPGDVFRARLGGQAEAAGGGLVRGGDFLVPANQLRNQRPQLRSHEGPQLDEGLHQTARGESLPLSARISPSSFGLFRLTRNPSGQNLQSFPQARLKPFVKGLRQDAGGGYRPCLRSRLFVGHLLTEPRETRMSASFLFGKSLYAPSIDICRKPRSFKRRWYGRKYSVGYPSAPKLL